MRALSVFPFSHTNPLVIVFDINSSTVGVAIAEYRKETPIRIVFTHRELIVYGEKHDAESLGVYVGEAIKKAGLAAVDSFRKHGLSNAPYSLHALIHSPWSESKSHRAESTLPDEVVVTRELLQQFLVKKLPTTAVAGNVQFDHHITQIELNGYATGNPYQKKASQIAMTAISSSMSEMLFNSMTNAFAEVFPNHEVHMDAFLYAVTQMDEFFEGHDAYTLVDIGGEYSSLTMVRDSIVVGSIGISFGTEYLVRTIMDLDTSSRHAAVSQITMYLDNTCTPSQCRKIETALDTAGQEWIRAFGDACATISKTNKIPTHTYIAVDKRYEPWFKKLIDRIDFAHFSVTGQVLEPKLFDIELAKRKLAFTEGTRRDLVLSLDVLFVDK